MGSEIVSLEGDEGLEWVAWADRGTGETTRKPIGSVFVMIGAEPNSGWLYGTVKLDKKGFILTGGEEGFNGTPYATSMPGMFAVGDVRSASVKASGERGWRGFCGDFGRAPVSRRPSKQLCSGTELGLGSVAIG